MARRRCTGRKLLKFFASGTEQALAMSVLVPAFGGSSGSSASGFFEDLPRILTLRDVSHCTVVSKIACRTPAREQSVKHDVKWFVFLFSSPQHSDAEHVQVPDKTCVWSAPVADVQMWFQSFLRLLMGSVPLRVDSHAVSSERHVSEEDR